MKKKSVRLPCMSCAAACMLFFSSISGAVQAQTSGPAKASTAAKPLAQSLSGAAREAYDDGKLLYADGDFAGASLKFQTAYETSKDPRLLWNMAAAEKNLRHYARAEELLLRYLDTSGSFATDAERQECRALLETLRSLIGSVEVRVSEPGAAVSIDDVAVGTSPLAKPLRLDIGTHVLRVIKPGFAPFSTKQLVTGGGQATVAVELVRERNEGMLRVEVPSNARVLIDGKDVGSGTWQGKLPSGAHRLEVNASGKEPWRMDVVVASGQSRTIPVTLQDSPNAPSSGLPAWLVVGGGVVAAGLLGTGAYFLFKPEDKGPPPATIGTWATVDLR